MLVYTQGRLLPSPELIPFRLTRDLVAAMGVTGVEGHFRQCGIATMDVLRTHADAVGVVVDVFLHDPLYQWAMSPEQRGKRQQDGGSVKVVRCFVGGGTWCCLVGWSIVATSSSADSS